jgi:hypothetical protein
MSGSNYSFTKDRRLVGLRWFIMPVAANAILYTRPVFDGAATNAAIDFFSIPYWIMTALIGFRRARCITIFDFVFLVAGNILIITLLWQVHPQTHSSGS